MAEFTEGQEVRVKSGMFRRGVARIGHGQVITLTEEDLARSDLDQHVEPTGQAEMLREEGVVEDEDGDVLANDLTEDALREHLSALNIKNSKEFLSDDRWTADGMKLAYDSEAAGKARPAVLEFIEGRLLDLEEDEEPGSA